jgi:PD-(D/E)XK nuclease superfamily
VGGREVTAALELPPVEVPRDRWGRPLLVPSGGGDRVAYRRVTTVAGWIENRRPLEKWLQRGVAVGLVERPDLYAQIGSTGATIDDGKLIDEFVEKAHEAAKANAAANLGSALHLYAARIDRGHDVKVLPQWQADLDAYRRAVDGFEWRLIEELVVLEDFGIAGSPDRIAVLPDGRVVIADLKTTAKKENIVYQWLKNSIQLALYAHASEIYDPATDTRRPKPDVDLTEGIIIHLPVGSGTCDLHRLDLVKGWRYFELAWQVNEARNDDDLHSPYEAPESLEKALEASLADVRTKADTQMRAELIARRSDPDEGPMVDDVNIGSLREQYEAGDRLWIARKVKEAEAIGQGPGRLSLRELGSERRYFVLLTLVHLRDHDATDDQVVRDLLLAIDPELADERIPVGAALALLTAAETRRLAHLASNL